MSSILAGIPACLLAFVQFGWEKALVVAALVGVAFAPLFMRFDLCAAHGAFTACVTPPLAVALLLGLC